MNEPIQFKVLPKGVEVVVSDGELLDFVEDLLTENGFDYEHLREEELGGEYCYILHFGGDVPVDRLREVLESIPKEEIARILKLNN